MLPFVPSAKSDVPDQRRAALLYVSDAFAEALLDGIEADCFAHAALVTAFQGLVDVFGEDVVARLAEQLPERIRGGEFTIRDRH